MTHHLQSTLDRLVALDTDAVSEASRKDAEAANDPGSHYPRFVGALLYWVKEAIGTARKLMEDLQAKERRIKALEWAAETILNDTDVSARNDRSDLYEDLYAAANAIEKAMKAGMTDDQLRKRLAHNLEDDEIQHECLIEPSERCENCGEVRCVTCGDADEPLNPRFIEAVNRAGEEEQANHQRRGRS